MDMPMGPVSYGALFLAGLLGSLGHCLGMCMPLVVMASMRFGGSARAYPALGFRYHAARLAVYSALGALAGAAGAMAHAGSGSGQLGGLVSVVLGLGTLAFGLANLGWVRPLQVMAGGRWLAAPLGRSLALPPALGSLAAGALNGLLPCPLVYSALLMAAALGSPLSGAAGMAVFGAGTLPLLFLAGFGGVAWRGPRRWPWLRAAGVLILLVGLQLVLRGAAGLGLIPHARLLGIAIW